MTPPYTYNLTSTLIYAVYAPQAFPYAPRRAAPMCTSPPSYVPSPLIDFFPPRAPPIQCLSSAASVLIFLPLYPHYIAISALRLDAADEGTFFFIFRRCTLYW